MMVTCNEAIKADHRIGKKMAKNISGVTYLVGM